MTFKNHPVIDCTPLFSIKWKDSIKEFKNEISTVWQGNIFQIKLHSFIGRCPTGQRLELTSELGISVEKINDMLDSDLEGTGICTK